jgi:hypothetical protein
VDFLPKSFHIELIATDGKVQKRVLWAHCAPNGVYCGLCSAHGDDFHVTYHADGNVFVNSQGKAQKTNTGQTFKEFKGHTKLLWSGITKFLGHGFYPDYSLKKANALVSVDVRSYEQDIGCVLFMVEASFDALSSLVQELKSWQYQQVTELHCFMECTPWIVIALWVQ